MQLEVEVVEGAEDVEVREAAGEEDEVVQGDNSTLNSYSATSEFLQSAFISFLQKQALYIFCIRNTCN